MSDSPYALRSYESTCNKLAKYVRKKGWETLEEYEVEMPEEMEDLYIGLELLETEARSNPKKEITSFQNSIKTLRDNFVVSLYDVAGPEEFITRMQSCKDTLQILVQQLDTLDTSDSYFRTKIHRSLREDTAEMQSHVELILWNV